MTTDDFLNELHFFELLGEVTIGTATFLDNDRIIRGIHPATDREGHGCWIHHPSNHALAYAPAVMVGAMTRTYRICEHKIMHQDIDELAYLRSLGQQLPDDVNCDGCCVGPLLELSDDERYVLDPAIETGLWEVTTEGSTHLFDLDAMTWARYPRATAIRTLHDGNSEPIVEFGTLPRKNRRTLLWYRSPGSGKWALSSPVVRIKRVEFDDPGDLA